MEFSAASRELWSPDMRSWDCGQGVGTLGRGVRLSRLISALGTIWKPYRKKF